MLPRLSRLGPHRAYNTFNAPTGRVTGFVPPPPSSLPRPSTRRPPSRLLRRTAYTAATIGVLYAADEFLNYSTFTRNLRTIATCAVIAADYKLNFRASKDAGQLAAIHERNADRVIALCFANGGLYQKIGQAIAMQSAILPPVVQERFTRFFDETPQASWAEVERVVKEEYGARYPGLSGAEIVDQVFVPGSFERRAVGSASIAQVHHARLRTGEEVAVKVQKPWIKRQVGMDLAVFQVVTYFFSTFMFGLPLSFLTPYICERLSSETDFYSEAHNALQTAQFIESEPSLRGRIHVPKVYTDLSTRRIMVAEWIDGVVVSDRELLTGPYRDASSVGHPITTPRSIAARHGPLLHRRNRQKGSNVYGLGVSERAVMQTMVDVFCAQMFLFGWVHCDPHPGNILVRRLPNGAPQLVLLDHGLYITTTPEFRRDYALFWKSLFTLDNATITRIASSWGIGNADLFASATLLKPYRGGAQLDPKDAPKTAYEASQKAREKIAEFIVNQDQMPRELVFIGRNLRIVQENNRSLGAPVNRLKIIANWASYALTRQGAAAEGWWSHVLFKVVVFGLDMAFLWGRLKQRLWGGRGWEEEMEARMRMVAKEEFGVEIQGDSVFNA